MALGAPGYPERLRQLRRPPQVVYLVGPWADPAPAVAIVGARDANGDGLDVARGLAADLARAGFAVLSGLARGIDSAAHEGALDAGGRSGAVLGTGIGQIYPPESATLTHRLRRSLGLLSELPPGDSGRPSTFASRNRLLAALADAVLVVQGRARSGALITAREGLALGRPVGAVPWDCRDPLGEAPHRLIRAGLATLVRHAGDVIDLLRIPPGAPPRDAAVAPWDERGGGAAGAGPAPGDGTDAERVGLDPGEALLLSVLRSHPQRLDQAAARAGMTAAAAAAAVVALELRGLAESAPGGLIRRARGGR
ncbi:MAG TPA: DNA-processing protein DprA [Candidatus Eisenbacteria bacterium]